MFVQNGGRFLDQIKVMNIIPNGSIVTIETNVGKTFRTHKLIITAGAWANKVLEPTGLQLPLKVRSFTRLDLLCMFAILLSIVFPSS